MGTLDIRVKREHCPCCKISSVFCVQHEEAHAKAPLQPILVTSPLKLLNVDFTSIEIAIKVDQPSHVVNVLVLCDHFIRHVMAYVNSDHTAKAVAKFMWQGYISIFRALAKLLSY